MASSVIEVRLIGLERVQRALFAAGDLLTAVEHADEVLVTDEILEEARKLREAMEALR